MRIFEQDRKYLNTNLVKAQLVVPITRSDDKLDEFIENLEYIKKHGCDAKIGRTLAKIAKEPHPDLMYGQAILVSTVINKNDDVFLPEETWKARNTPVNTPFNDEHIDVDIIGHIIAARPLDSSGNEITQDEPPDYFDIQVDWVVYSSIFPTIAQDIAEKAPKGEKFVSMEATFNDFDYALVNTEGNVKLVKRNEDTAFLTKHLRAYGGDGKFDGYKVARVLRDFRFSGMGNVDTPANPASEYTKVEEYEFASEGEFKDNFKSDSKVVLYFTKGNIMKVENLEQAQTIIADLTDKLEKLQGKQDEQLKIQVSELTQSKTQLTEELNGEKSKVEVATQKLTEANTKIDDLIKEVNTLKADLQTKVDELSKIDTDTKTEKRVAQLRELGVEVKDEKRTSIASMTDDIFDDLVEFTKAASSKTDTKEKTQTQEVSDATNKAKSDLDKVEPDKKAALENTAGEDDDVQKTAAGLVEVLKGLKPKYKRAKVRV
jgi:hypothetical protein